MPLDLTSLEQAIASLETALRVYLGTGFPDGSPEKETLRDGVIQRFEYTFELSWKMLKRHLEHHGLENVDGFSNRELFRAGFEKGLVREAADWIEYLHKRNLTSHTYKREAAEKVYAAVSQFLADARYLLARLKEKNA